MTTTAITPKEFEKAVARACLRAIAKWTREDPLRGGDQTAVRYGAMIGEIADEADLSIPQTRRRLQALQADGRLMRDDHRGGSTAWWLVGLAETQRAHPAMTVVPAVTTTATAHAAMQSMDANRQAFTPPAARQHWSDVLGVARDCSTSEARAAFSTAIATLDEADPDYPNQRKHVHDAIDACCREHEIQIQE